MSKIFFLKTLRLEEFPPKPVFYLFQNKPISLEKGDQKVALDDYMITSSLPLYKPYTILYSSKKHVGRS